MSMEIRKPLKPGPTDLQKIKTRRAVNHFMQTAVKDRVLLLSIAAGGMNHFRGIARTAFKGLLVDEALLEEVFAFLVVAAGPEPARALDTILASGLVNLKLERLRQLADLVHTERELDEALAKLALPKLEKAAIRQEIWRIVQARRN